MRLERSGPLHSTQDFLRVGDAVSNKRPLPCQSSRVFTMVYRRLRESPTNKPNRSRMHRLLLRRIQSFYAWVAARLLHNLCVLSLLRLFPDSSSIHPEFIDVCLGRAATNKHWQQFWKPKVKEVRTCYTGAAPYQMYPNTGGKTITTIAAHTA